MRKIIKGNVNLNNLYLTELFDLSDVEVRGDFYCASNNLTNLEGSPITVTGDFICSNNQLSSLNGAPLIVDGDFYCNKNHLTSLKGAPRTVNGSFLCDINNLTSLEGLPETIGGDLVLDGYLEDKFSEEYIRGRCKIKGEILFIDEDDYEGLDDLGHGEY